MAYRYNGEFFVSDGKLATLATVPILDMLANKLIEYKLRNPLKYEKLDDFVKASEEFDEVIMNVMSFVSKERLVKRNYLWEDFQRKLASVRRWGRRAKEDVFFVEVEPTFMSCYSNVLFYLIRGLAVPGLSMRNNEN